MGFRALAVLSVAVMVPLACGHAVLYSPKARNWVAHLECQGGKDCPQYPGKCESKKNPGCKDYDPQSLNAWGVQGKAKAAGKWPSPIGTFGLCGDPVQFRNWVDLKDQPYMFPTPSQATYTAGDIVEFEVGIYAEHQGHYEFRICDKGLDGEKLSSIQEGEDCLKKWVLKRAPPSGNGPDSQPIDTRHPGRWYVGASASKVQVNFLNESTVVAGPDWDDADAVGLQMRTVYKMRYIIPEDLSCELCTLQWYWPTANTCAYDADVGKYWKEHGLNPVGATTVCQGGKIHGEEFWNCADITVKPKGGDKPPSNPGKGRRRKSSRRRKSGKGGGKGGRRRRRRKSSRRRKR